MKTIPCSCCGASTGKASDAGLCPNCDGYHNLETAALRPFGAAVRTPVRFTPQQHRALSFCALGLWDAEIAVRMGLHTRTVKFHMQNCMQTLGVHSRTAAACRALAWGLLPEVIAALCAIRDEEATP